MEARAVNERDGNFSDIKNSHPAEREKEMNYYKMTTIVSYKGREIRSRYTEFLTEEEPHDSVTKITWDNIEELYKYATCDMKSCKKGRRLHIWGNLDIDGFYFKEWEKPNLTFEVKITYKMLKPSIKTILEYYDGEAAIKYLLERGMTVVAAK